MLLPLRTIDTESFSPYGWIIQRPPSPEVAIEGKVEFSIICREEESKGWRLAYLAVSQRSTDTLEHHPHSLESFEPISGIAILLLAEHDSPEAIEAFVLDKPVVLKKGIWHEVIALSAEAEMKIAENNQVTSVKRKLPGELKPFLGF